MSATVQLEEFTITHTGPGPYLARSADDRDPEWPVWFVADAVGFNGIQVKNRLWKFFSKEVACAVADALNEAS